LTLSGKTHDNLFDEKGYYKVEGFEYIDGNNVILVSATDYANNTIEKNFNFNIKLETETK
jgi:hypothetical protein